MENNNDNDKKKKGAMKPQMKIYDGVSADHQKKPSKKAALEVDTLAGFVIIVIFIVVIITIMLKNKEFIQRLLP